MTEFPPSRPIQIPNCIYRRRRDYQPQTNGENSSSVKTDGTDGVHPVSTAMDLEKAEDRVGIQDQRPEKDHHADYLVPRRSILSLLFFEKHFVIGKWLC